MDEGMILVTGAAGVIGRGLLRRLAGDGRPVTGLDRVAFEAPPGVPALLEDLTGPVAAVLPWVHTIVHLAAVMSNSRDVPREGPALVAANVAALLRVLRLAPGARRLVLASSMVVYGPPDTVPVREDHPTRPANLYAVGKVAAEQVAAIWARREGRSACSLRIGSVYGPDDPPGRAIPSFVAAVREGRAPVVRGEAVRDYIFVDDVVEACATAVDSTAGGACNTGTGRGTGTLALARLVLAAAGLALAPDVRGGPPGPAVVLCPERASRELGFVARVPLEEGLRRLLRGEGAA